jgi:hypothetical protein
MMRAQLFLLAAMIVPGLDPGISLTAAEANAQGVSPLKHQCQSIEELIETYPQVAFTKMSPNQMVLWLKAAPHADVGAVWFGPYPNDPSVMVVHLYDAKGCWLDATQVPKAKFEALVMGDGV